MKIEWLLYFIDVLGSFRYGFFTLAIIIAAIFIMLIICLLMTHDDSTEIAPMKKYVFLNLLILIIFTTLGIFIPSQNTMYAMALAHYSKDSTIPQKVLQAIEVKLDDIIGKGEK